VKLGVSVDVGHVRAVLMDSDGAVGGRAESMAADVNDAIVEAVRGTLAGANGSRPSATALSFPYPDSRSWPSDFSFILAAIGENVPVRDRKCSTAQPATSMPSRWT
jgi:hypothetical protein